MMHSATKTAKEIIPMASLISNSELTSYLVLTFIPIVALALSIKLEGLNGVISNPIIKFSVCPSTFFSIMIWYSTKSTHYPLLTNYDNLVVTFPTLDWLRSMLPVFT